MNSDRSSQQQLSTIKDDIINVLTQRLSMIDQKRMDLAEGGNSSHKRWSVGSKFPLLLSRAAPSLWLSRRRKMLAWLDGTNTVFGILVIIASYCSSSPTATLLVICWLTFRSMQPPSQPLLLLTVVYKVTKVDSGHSYSSS